MKPPSAPLRACNSNPLCATASPWTPSPPFTCCSNFPDRNHPDCVNYYHRNGNAPLPCCAITPLTSALTMLPPHTLRVAGETPGLFEDPQWELAVLATVNGFYQKLLHDYMDGDVPVPMGLDAESLATPGDLPTTVATLRRWLSLLDMA